MQFRILIICILTTYTLLASAQVQFNEVSSSNKNVLDDEDGDSSDWIELYNASESDLNLSQFYLTDRRKDTTKWQFGNAAIPAGDFLIVFASDKDRPNGNELHTNFKLGSSGETIWLFNQNKGLVDSLTIPFLSKDVSFGCSEDGNNTRVFFETPTPGTTNNGSVFADHIIAYAPTFSHISGVYQGAFELTLNSEDAGSTIRYSTDGSEPNQSNSIYSEPIAINETAIVSARVFKDGLLDSKTVVGSFIFRQGQTLPIISLSTHPGYFFDADTGIYELGPNASTEFPYFGANFWSDTEIPVNVQWIDTYGKIGFDQKMGVQIHGGTVSRTRPMRSLRLLAKEKYGKNEIDYSLFSTKLQPKNKRFLLRNSGSDYLKTMFRDGFIHNVLISNGLHVDAVCFNPVEVYLNGQFWGIHNAREKVDRYYLKYNFGYDDDNVDLLEEQDDAMEGNFDAFNLHESIILNLDLTEDDNFGIAGGLFDVLNIADYYISETYINHLDWPYNNLKFWRARVDTSKWRYIIFDLDATLGGVSFAPVEFDALNRALGSYGDTNRHVIIFRKLLENRTYFEYFINRYCDLANTVFSVKNFSESVDKAADRIEYAIPRHYERWGAEENDWYEEVEIVRTYVKERPPFAITQLQQFYELDKQATIHMNVYPPRAGKIDLNSISLREFPFKGIYFEDIAISVGVSENQGFRFSHWETNRSELNPAAVNQTFLPIDGDSLTAVFIGNSTFSKLDVFPNPASSVATVRFVNEKEGRVVVYLNSLDGRTKLELLNRIIQGGSHNLELQLPNIEGIFLLTVNTETSTNSQKLVLVKRSN
ncbi:MAG: hypothetical protein ACJATE_000051 [Bacteroidia bacterium]